MACGPGSVALACDRGGDNDGGLIPVVARTVMVGRVTDRAPADLDVTAFLRSHTGAGRLGQFVEATRAVDVSRYRGYVPMPEAPTRGDQPLLSASILGAAGLPAPSA